MNPSVNYRIWVATRQSSLLVTNAPPGEEPWQWGGVCARVGALCIFLSVLLGT